jgi:hypothetical protein
MSISRRKFLRSGTFVAIAAVIPATVLAQSRKERDGNPFDQQVAQPDPLSYYNKAAFTSYLNSIFRVSTGYSVVEVALIRVKDLPAGGPAAPAGSESFSLLFAGGSKEFEQGTYKIEHSSLGSFQMFLVPSGADQYGAQTYLATINRIGYSPALMSAPTRTTKAVGSNPETPTKPQTVAPVPAATPIPIPTPKAKPAHKRKPSWKTDGDVEDFDGLVIDQ